jgi:hypothetical protein
LAIAALLLVPSAASAAWSVTPTPVIPGPAKSLLGVDCQSASSCFAVGVVDTGTLNPLADAPIIEHWDGTSWQLMQTPNQYGSLGGISCPRSNFCFAVGSTLGTLPGKIERWDGTSWSIQPSPTEPTASLDDVSCSGVLACTAVGTVGTTPPPGPSPNTRTLAERWDATGWHVQATPSPPVADRSELGRVSCPVRRTCTAVGASLTGDDTSPLVERWFGRVNAWGELAAPAGTFSLGGVSCPNGSECVVVGSSGASPNQASVMAARRFGLGSWSVFPLIALPGSYLSAVDCAVSRSCHATGNWGNGLIAERFDGTNWQVQGIPTPGVSIPHLADISCPSRFFCMAVGSGHDPNFGIGSTLAMKWTP